jgi:hypothetical protein
MTSVVLDIDPAMTSTPALAGDSHADAARRGGWTLAIDFGTTFTVAAVVNSAGASRLIDLEGDGSS